MDDSTAQRGLVLLLTSAALLFSANSHRLSLLPLDDCHYAQKGVEMYERGAFFTVTWNGQLTHQNPPLQFWILSRSFALVGLNDFAARLPSMLMALGVLAFTFAIGRATLGNSAALAGVTLLLTTNEFLQNARRCMLEIPTCFWVSLFFLVYVHGLRRPRWLVFLGVPLAGAILTKSVIGLVPLAVLAVSFCWKDLRPTGGVRHLLFGVGLGLAGGVSWTLHQGLLHGWSGIKSHYFGEVGRAASDSGLADYVLAYPWIILRAFQPVVVPGLVGAVWLWRRAPRSGPARERLLVLWIVVWLVVASASSARIARYVWPVLVPLSLLAGALLARWSERLVRALAFVVVPAALVTAAVLYWVAPQTLTRDLDAPFKAAGGALRETLPEGSAIPLLGEYDWRLANPLLYYGHQAVGAASLSMGPVLEAARRLPRTVMLVDAERDDRLVSSPLPAVTRIDLGRWRLVDLHEGEPASH